MWRRFQQNKAMRQQGSTEASLGTSLLEGRPYELPPAVFTHLEHSSSIDSLRTLRPPRPPREPPNALPIRPHQPLKSAPPRQRGERPPSSLYSQPSPKARNMILPRMDTVARRYGERVEISPPSSPELNPVPPRQYDDGSVSPNISPVDEMPVVTGLQLSQPSSIPTPRVAPTNIPVLRRERRHNQLATAASISASGNEQPANDFEDKEDHGTRWDSRTGESTMAERGRSTHVKPLNFVPPSNSIYNTAVDHGQGLRTTALIGQHSFGERIRKIRERAENALMTADSRPEWKGSSGRSAIVAPVADRKNLPTLEIPPKNSKRGISPRITDPGRGISTAPAQPVEIAEPLLPSLPRAESPVVIPVAAYQTMGTSPPRYESLRASVEPSVSSVSSPPAVPEFQEPSSINYPMYQSHPGGVPYDVQYPQLNRKASITSIERNFREGLNIRFPPPAFREQPVSRFSVTTYATTTATTTASTTSSPRMSTDSAPPMPSPPLPQEHSPIVNRRRPKVQGSFDSTKATARKAVPSSPILINLSPKIPNPRPRPPIRNSIYKMLPKSPAEAASVDLVSSLQAQLDNLAHRRNNLQKSIRQMTELMPTDVLGRGMEKQRQADEKKKLEIVKQDLADVVRGEHDIGLRLHRALKRRDDGAVFEPTSLWVRRVTG